MTKGRGAWPGDGCGAIPPLTLRVIVAWCEAAIPMRTSEFISREDTMTKGCGAWLADGCGVILPLTLRVIVAWCEAAIPMRTSEFISREDTMTQRVWRLVR